MGCRENVLLNVECKERQIEQKCNPVPIDKEQEGQKAMDGSFRDNVCVETVAEIDRINVVTVASSSQRLGPFHYLPPKLILIANLRKT